MHASSLENMQRCFERFVCGPWSESRDRVLVLDVGGADVNGSYADIFSSAKFDYVAADVVPGKGVDLLLEDPYVIPCQDESVDLVISGQVFEHVELFWELFREMSRIVKRDGFIFLVAPSAGPIHRYPVDCYRFYPDAYEALAKHAEIDCVDWWLDDRGPWNDLVGVFSKTPSSCPGHEELRRRALSTCAENAFTKDRVPVPVGIEAADAETETSRGEQSHLEVLAAIHQALEPRFYLEIGVREGASLALASCPSVGVDPAPGAGVTSTEDVRVFAETSDLFFDLTAETALSGRPIDLAFIDGMHRFEFVLRDFMNIERLSEATTVIVIDDVFPNNPVQASRRRRSRVWCGDVWKLYHCLMTRRPDLRLFALDAKPAGLLVVGGLDRECRTLRDVYNPLVRSYREMEVEEHATSILEREGALPPSDDALFEFLRRVRVRRTAASRPARLETKARTDHSEGGRSWQPARSHR